MELVQLYNQKLSVYHIEKLIERSLVSVTSNKLRPNFYSVVLTLNDSLEALEAGKYLVTELNEMVSRNLVHRLQIKARDGYYHSRRSITYTLIKPFVSKSSEAGKDTFIYYEPDKSTTTIKLVATSVHKELFT
jgi:hypothetical protein